MQIMSNQENGQVPVKLTIADFMEYIKRNCFLYKGQWWLDRKTYGHLEENK